MILNSLQPVVDKEDQIILQAFGLALRELRDAKHLTQQELSDLSGVDRAYISNLEKGKKVASIISVFKLSNTLKVNPSDIVMLAEQKLKKSDEK